MTSLRYLLDTSAFLAHFRQESGWTRVQAMFEAGESEILASSVSLTEFCRRLRELGSTEEDARLTVENYRELLDELVVIDEAVAFAAFHIACHVTPRLPLADALIAASARERGACLVHRDRHMAPIPGSIVEQLDLAKEPEPK